MPDPTRTAAPDAPAATASGAGETIPPGATPGSPVAPTARDRYLLGEEIARGGMGAVYRATDTVLGREVAVKVLHERYAPDSGAARRFADEARITGQLQHPAIPPVHDLGALSDGRPFLAMKLIKGDTLDEHLKRRAGPDADRSRFVAVFETVCQAVAYAHAHNVLHRDLKPANVMVGGFAEVQVMDWGLAKVLTTRDRTGAAPADPDETAGGTDIRPLRDSDDQYTQAGSVLGTPAFMPPEQAIGAVDQIDRRSDVFGLGGILAAILTGRPPFQGDSAENTRQLAAKGKVADCFARLDGCGADPDLVALCKRCLATEQDDRPADAGAVASAVAGLRAAADERARQAELDRVKADGEKAAADLRVAEQKKRSRLRMLLLASVGLLLLGGGAFAWWQDRDATVRRTEAEGRDRDERERLGRNAAAVGALLGQCEEALRAGDAAKAELLLTAAEKRAAEGGADDSADRLSRCAADLAVLRELDEIRRYEWTSVEGLFPTWTKLAARHRATFARFGVGPGAVPAGAAARWVAASAVRDRLVAALDGWLRGEKSDWVRAVLRAVDPDRFRDLVRDQELAGSSGGIVALALLPEVTDQPPAFLALLGQETALPVPRRRDILLGSLRRRPGDLGTLMGLGRLATDQAEWDAAARWYEAAVAAAPANPTPHARLGQVLEELGESAAAVPCHRQAYRLSPADPEMPFALGTGLYRAAIQTGRRDLFAEGLPFLREAVRAKPDEPRYHCNLGHLLRETGEYAEAVAEMRRGHDLGRREKDWTYPSAEWVAECERLAALDEKRATVLAGQAKPKDSAEMFELARISRARKRYADARRFYADGFDEEFIRLDGASLMRDKIAAAGAAVLAAAGAGVQPQPAEKEQAACRQQAREWLDEIVGPLRFVSGVPNARASVHAQMTALLANPDFASLRDPTTRAALPKAEADKWAAFWDDIRQIHARTVPLELAPIPRKAK